MGIRSFQKTAWKAADAYATVKRVVPEPAERPEIDLTKASQQDENDHTPDVPVEKFHKPAEGRITSHFRSDTRPNHHGIDIAKAGDVPIYAIADGEVMRSYNGGNGGETIITQHNVDGQYYLTLNAHLRGRNVKTGEKIKRGQIIGYMGNTGRSTGQHLHFEIHRGVWNSERSNAVNPLKYFTW
jgi:murein DD-endopeptidase MepM/ murein hydrolase activator NlpD